MMAGLSLAEETVVKVELVMLWRRWVLECWEEGVEGGVIVTRGWIIFRLLATRVSMMNGESTGIEIGRVVNESDFRVRSVKDTLPLRIERRLNSIADPADEPVILNST